MQEERRGGGGKRKTHETNATLSRPRRGRFRYDIGKKTEAFFNRKRQDLRYRGTGRGKEFSSYYAKKKKKASLARGKSIVFFRRPRSSIQGKERKEKGPHNSLI